MGTTILSRRPKKYKTETGIKTRPLVFVDLEFSGLQLNHVIIEIGCLVVDQQTFKIKKEWLQKIKLESSDAKNADKNSLKIIGYSEKDWERAVSLKEAMVKFNRIADGCVLIGYNVSWDFMFLEKSFHDLKIKPKFHWQILDVMSMVFNKFYNAKSIKGMRMKEVERFLKIKHGVWHNPLDDARATYEIWKKIK